MDKDFVKRSTVSIKIQYFLFIVEFSVSVRGDIMQNVGVSVKREVLNMKTEG